MNILLIHGLGRTPISMWSMAQALRRACHKPESFGYTTLTESFDQIVLRLSDRLQKIAHHTLSPEAISPETISPETISPAGSYGIVTHSMGAVLLRAALNNASFPPPKHVVMLAPPNQSPRLAQIASHFPPFLWFAGQSGEHLACSDFYAKLPTLTCPYTIITGNAGPTGHLSLFGTETNDFVVSTEESKIHAHDVPIEVSALHSFIMNNKLAQAATVEAFSSAQAHRANAPKIRNQHLRSESSYQP